MALLEQKKILNQLVVIMFCMPFLAFNAIADISVKYQNKQNPDEYLQIFSKNGKFKVISTNNTIKIVDLKKSELTLYENGKDHFYTVPLNDQLIENKEKNGSEEMFSAKLRALKGKKEIGGVSCTELKYTSSIDKTTSIFAMQVNESELQTIINSLRVIHREGNKLLKASSFYYSLIKGFLPIGVESEDLKWEALEIRRDVAKSTFNLPDDMKEKDHRLIFKDAAEAVSRDIESEISIK